ncbi:hypothetical protein SAMN05216215_1011157 [Saccharopolyspora shandongensis]|uniref:Uncharacterized protein n=1 Tax=Saccharopolyspora shandongensis TaxID=418495 RepID=A0A1H3C2D2_9PSEU|nr:hypothetical protein SAMN05216215_1011157 [Saccharopolyspora shandongensis]
MTQRRAARTCQQVFTKAQLQTFLTTVKSGRLDL